MSTIIRTRSPFFIRTPEETSSSLSYFNIQITIKEGTTTSTVCGDLSTKYVLNKKPITGEDSVTIEISEIINDFFTNDFPQATVNQQSFWVLVVTTAKEADGTTIGTGTTTTYLAQEGYNEFKDGVNYTAEPNLMITSDYIQYKKGQLIKMPVNVEKVNTVEFKYNGSVISTNSVSDSTESGNKIQYVKQITSSNQIDEIVITYDTTSTRTIKVEEVDECKYPVNKITFLNKWGAYEDLYFFKKSTESLETQKENFNRSIFQARKPTARLIGGACTTTYTYNVYDTNQHMNKTFNANGTETLQLNTGFVSESMNDSFRELMVSEYVWLTDSLSNVLPVTLKDSSLTYKTGLNDKMINYTMSFEKSFKLINNVR